jgi:hypothetical protein
MNVQINLKNLKQTLGHIFGRKSEDLRAYTLCNGAVLKLLREPVPFISMSIV